MRLCCPQAAWCCGDLLIVSVVVIAKNTRVAKIMNKLRNFAISREFMVRKHGRSEKRMKIC